MTFNVEDYYTYIKERNTFPVSFLNVNQLSLNEVTDIFKIYGDLKVIQSKSPTGYCFVNFFNEESAINCVLSMKNHDKIKLCRPNKRDPLPRSELNKEKENNNNDDKIIKTSISDRLKINPVDDNSDDKEKPLIIDKPTSSPSSPSPPPTPVHPAKLIEQKKNLLQSFKSFDNLSEQLIEEQQKKVELFDDKIVDKSSDKEHMLLETNKKDEKIIQATNEQFIETDDAGSVSNVPHDLSPITSTAINTCETNSSHSVLLEKIEEEDDEEGVPCGALSTCQHIFIDNDDVFYTDENYLTFNVTDKPMQVIEAQDIIVAGIPAELGTIGILHYLEKFNPILITNIKRTYTEPSVRYCHVYFTTPQDAENAEIYFDDKLFGSSRIIALRPDSLAQQILKAA